MPKIEEYLKQQETHYFTNPRDRDLVLLALVTWKLEMFVTGVQGNQAPEKAFSSCQLNSDDILRVIAAFGPLPNYSE